MNKNILVVAPHPDDETLGCGGALLKHKNDSDHIHWMIATGIYTDQGFSREQVEKRDQEMQQVKEKYGFSTVHNLGFPTTKLDTISLGSIIEKVGSVFKRVLPEIVYVPYRGDVHTDHRIVFDCVMACSKWFRFNSIKRVLAYETLSETEFGSGIEAQIFQPNVFIDISDYLEPKIEIMKIYASELGSFPFPRSEEAIRSLAYFRGAASGCRAAEAFMLLKEIC